MKPFARFIAVLIVSSACHQVWGLSVFPGRTEVTLAPGGSVKAIITAQNETKERVQVEVSKKDWFVLPANKNLTVEKWLEIKGKTYFWLNPGESRQVSIKVKCPKEAEGELVGMVSFAYQPENPTMLTPVISVSVYNTVSGTEKRSGEVTHLAVRRWQGSFQAAAAIKATGNVHLRPSGFVTIRNSKGDIVGTVELKEGNPAYPGQERGYLGTNDSIHLQRGHYLLDGEFKSGDVMMKAERTFDVKADGSIVMFGEPSESVTEAAGKSGGASK